MTALSPLAYVTIVFAALAAIILVWYVIFRPSLTNAVKFTLFLGFGAFPIITAGTGNYAGFEATKAREFCGSCHVMKLHTEDANDPNSKSLSARHARNPMFGGENCYACHADYGMYGTAATKLGGMRHVWLYVTEYRNMPMEQAKTEIKIRRPFPNTNCMQCHSTQNELWQKTPDHASSLTDVRSGKVSCASEGCHGLAHPFFQPPKPAQAHAMQEVTP